MLVVRIHGGGEGEQGEAPADTIGATGTATPGDTEPSEGTGISAATTGGGREGEGAAAVAVRGRAGNRIVRRSTGETEGLAGACVLDRVTADSARS